MNRELRSVSSGEDRVGAFIHDEPVLLAPAAGGPLSGWSCGVKDVFDIQGYRTGYGNPTWRATHAPAARHAPAVQALLNAGVHVVGKTHTDELAFSVNGDNFHYGAPVNSAAPGHVTGGSSCGSAAAVAAGLCDIALGTDTGGSVRLPASFCGLFGMRPSRGAVSAEGVCRLAPSFDTVGWFARDAAALRAVGAVLLPADSESLSDGPIGFARDVWRMVEADNADALREHAMDMVKMLGGVRPLALEPDVLESWFDCFRTLQFAEIAQELGPWIDTENPTLGPGIAERIAQARALDARTIELSGRDRESVRTNVDAMLDLHSVLVLPTVPGCAPRRDLPIAQREAYRRTAMRLLCIAGLSGCPQVSMPLLTADGLPLGLSIISRRGTDRQLLALATRLSELVAA